MRISTCNSLSLFLLLLASSQLVYSIKIDRVILSSTVDANYLEFWPFVARVWKDWFGIQPTLAIISNYDVPVNKSLGDVFIFKKIPGVRLAKQAQNIRLLLPVLFESEVCLIADIDIIPVNKNFFTRQIKQVPQDNFLIFCDQRYRAGNTLAHLRRIPMCYVAAQGKLFKEIFHIKSARDIQSILARWGNNSDDESIMTSCLRTWSRLHTNCYLLGTDVCYKRGGRRIFYPTPENLKIINNGHLVDFHMHFRKRQFSLHWQEAKQVTDAIGLKVDYETILKEIELVKPYYETNQALLDAAENSDFAAVKSAIAHGADINTKDSDGLTALHWAAWKGFTDVAQLLINNFADVNAKNNVGHTPLHLATENNHTDIVRILTEKSVNFLAS